MSKKNKAKYGNCKRWLGFLLFPFSVFMVCVTRGYKVQEQKLTYAEFNKRQRGVPLLSVCVVAGSSSFYDAFSVTILYSVGDRLTNE
jgi:hypothetical protein